MISMLDYFGGNLANVGPPGALLERESNDVTLIENNCIKRESNQTKKT